VGDVFDLADGRAQPAAIQAVLVEISANGGEVALSRFVMTSVARGPRIMMLDVAQIFLRFFDDAMGAIPIAVLRLGWNPTGEKQAGQS
jgi:hypothetical protein